MSAPVLLVAVVGVGCGGDQASSGQQLPGGSEPVATIVGEGQQGQLLPGDQRELGPALVTTTAPRRPVGRPKIPVLPHAPVTRPPLQIQGITTTSTVVTTTSTTAPGS
jgi:hypothetical protein